MHDDAVARGRELVEQGNLSPRGMWDNLALCQYWKQQRELVSQRGQCSARCQCDQIPHPTRGHLICPHTWQPCARKRLSAIVSLWEVVCSGS